MNHNTHSPAPHRNILLALHLLVLAASVGLIAYISYDTFQNISFIADRNYIRVQLWVCLFFLFDITLEWILSPKKLKFLASNIFFIIVSIPYLSIITHYDLRLPGQLQYLLRFIPMLRAAYVLALVTGVLSANRISSLFMAYMALLISTIYFGSLMFFIDEHHVNPGVDTYWSALWWAIMDMTTTGSSINPMTPTGKTLGVILAAEGLILFPVFTVYITNALTRKSKAAQSASDGAARS